MHIASSLANYANARARKLATPRIVAVTRVVVPYGSREGHRLALCTSRLRFAFRVSFCIHFALAFCVSHFALRLYFAFCICFALCVLAGI